MPTLVEMITSPVAIGLVLLTGVAAAAVARLLSRRKDAKDQAADEAEAASLAAGNNRVEVETTQEPEASVDLMVELTGVPASHSHMSKHPESGVTHIRNPRPIPEPDTPIVERAGTQAEENDEEIHIPDVPAGPAIDKTAFIPVDNTSPVGKLAKALEHKAPQMAAAVAEEHPTYAFTAYMVAASTSGSYDQQKGYLDEAGNVGLRAGDRENECTEFRDTLVIPFRMDDVYTLLEFPVTVAGLETLALLHDNTQAPSDVAERIAQSCDGLADAYRVVHALDARPRGLRRNDPWGSLIAGLAFKHGLMEASAAEKYIPSRGDWVAQTLPGITVNTEALRELVNT